MSDLEKVTTQCEEEYDTVVLTLDDDSELECAIIDIFSVGDGEYISLLPVDENGEPQEDADFLIYRYIEEEGSDEPLLENIEDDDEFEMVADAYYEILDDMEFGEEESENE